MSLIRHLVDGRETGGAHRTGSVFDPATGAVPAAPAADRPQIGGSVRP